MASKENTTQYSSQNKNWYRDRYEAVTTQRNFLGIIALSSLLLALLSGAIILALLPQKTVMPFLIQVDDKSGYTQIIEQNSLETISADESLRRYFVIKFLQAREGYDAAMLETTSNTVRLLSQRTIFRRYWNEVINAQNKDSLYVQLGATGLRQVEIKSVQFLDPGRAQVRLSIATSDKQRQRKPVVEHYIALVTFEFLNLNLKVDEMAVNPLGFQVQEYTLDKDAFL